MAKDAAKIKATIQLWRKIDVGRVDWQEFRFRGLAAPLLLPVSWTLRYPSEWVSACNDRQINRDFEKLSSAFNYFESCYYPVLMSFQKSLIALGGEDFKTLAKIVAELSPGCLAGAPLRSWGGHGNDTKFIERHLKLIEGLLDIRFHGEVADMGLEQFLGAQPADGHWVLLSDLGNDILAFPRIRVTTSSLTLTALPATNILIVENESCVTAIPKVNDCIVVLGCGLDLSWLGHSPAEQKNVAYWGDIDSWGLKMLAIARQYCCSISALLMDAKTFALHEKFAVVEPVAAGRIETNYLAPSEQDLLDAILNKSKGRLEQEFLDPRLVKDRIAKWCQA